MKQILPFLTYNGQAEEAINWYHKAFPNSEITKLNRYGDTSKEEPDLILEGELKLGNQVIGFWICQRFPCTCLLGIYHFD